MWNWLKKITWASVIGYDDLVTKPKRARTKRGRYKADNKSTKDINEAWVGGKAPKKKRRIYRIKGKRYVLKK
jgi:hypothetical protein